MLHVLRYRGPFRNADRELTVNYSQHQDALAGHTNDFGRAIMSLLHGWETYQFAHAKAYEIKIGDDWTMGHYWAETGLAIKRLLDGETGGLDCGSIAANISDMLTAEGFKHDGYYSLIVEE